MNTMCDNLIVQCNSITAGVRSSKIRVQMQHMLYLLALYNDCIFYIFIMFMNELLTNINYNKHQQYYITIFNVILNILWMKLCTIVPNVLISILYNNEQVCVSINIMYRLYQICILYIAFIFMLYSLGLNHSILFISQFVKRS